MKKIVIVAAIALTGVVALSTQVGNMKPTINSIKVTFYDYQKALASGD
jgi:uncharacterized membrane protein